MQSVRPDKQLSKIVYKLLQTEKTLQQKQDYKPTERQMKEWASTYTKSNIR